MPSVCSILLTTSNRPRAGTVSGGSAVPQGTRKVVMIGSQSMNPCRMLNASVVGCLEFSIRPAFEGGRFLLPFLSGAFLTSAELAKIVESIYAGRVAVVPINLKRVTAHQFGAVRLERFDSEQRKRARRRGAGRAEFRARGAGAFLAEGSIRVRAVVAIGPHVGEGVGSDRELYRLRDELPSRTHGFSTSYRNPSVPGSLPRRSAEAPGPGPTAS